MRFLTSFLFLLSSLIAGDVIFRANALITNDDAAPSNTVEGSTVNEVIHKKKRTIRRLERVIELENTQVEERNQEVLSVDNPESIYYINRDGALFIHPNSVLDLRKVLNLSAEAPLYYGFEGKLEKPYVHPFRVPVDEELVYFADNYEEPSPRSVSVKVDSLPPILKTYELVGNSFTGKDGRVYYGSGSELRIHAEDKDSGIKVIRIFDEKGVMLQKREALFEQEKSWVVNYKFTELSLGYISIEIEDNVTNIFRSEKIPLFSDTNPPRLEIKVEPAQTAFDYENGNCPLGTKISVHAVDEESEVSEIQFRYPNTDWINLSSRLVLKKPGIYKIEFRAKDYFGNTSLPEYFECKVFEP